MTVRLIILSLILCLIPITNLQAEKNPKIANYYLTWHLNDNQVEELAKWDLVILDMEVQRNSPSALVRLKKLNPNIIILAYITSQEIISDLKIHPLASLRRELLAEIQASWWLRDKQGNKLSFWPGTNMLNISDQVESNTLGEKFNDFLPRFVKEKIQSSYLWDGIFYDNLWGDLNWLSNNLNVSDQEWQAGYLKMLQKTKDLCGENFLIVGNGKIYEPYLPKIHGKMLEGFPSDWEGSWSNSMEKYLKMPSLSRQPAIPIINVYHKDKSNYRLFRFGLTSTMLGEGYFSFDYDVSAHNQTWWYDEYEVNLGEAISAPYNLLENNCPEISPGLWRRDFENGMVLVNSSDKTQRIVFDKEVFEKIKGSQDLNFNDGSRINWLELMPNDGIILLNEIELIKQSSFLNGQFIRILNNLGTETRNGFFSYLSQFPALAEVLVVDLLGDKENEFVYSHQGEIVIVKNGKEINRFTAFHPAFKGKISLAIGDINGNGQLEIVAGAGYGGGPQVNVFNSQGKLVSTFFAYDKKFRGGVSVAVGDTNNNQKAEIITTPGPGGGPHIRIFDYLGKELSNFFAYDRNLRTGLSITSADILNNGKDQIIVAPINGKDLELKYFNEKGIMINSFIVKNNLESLHLSSFDTNNDGLSEILIGLNNY